MQREESAEADSNISVMTIGGLPAGVSNHSLTCIPVNPYLINDTIFASIPISIGTKVQAEVQKLIPTVPFRWKPAINGFFVNGRFAPNSTGEKPIAFFDSVSVEP